MTAKEYIEDRMAARPKAAPKLVNVRVRTDQLDRLQVIADVLTQRSGRRVTKNMLIVDAVQAFINELQEKGLDLDSLDKKLAEL